MSADSDALPLLPAGNAGTQFVDDARDFMSGNAGIPNAGPQTFFREHVTVANATGLHLYAHLTFTRPRYLALDDLEICSPSGICATFIGAIATFVVAMTFSYQFSSSRLFLPPPRNALIQAGCCAAWESDSRFVTLQRLA